MRFFKVTLLLLFVQVAIALAQNPKVRMEEVWTIGDKDKSSKEYMFRGPDNAKIDSKGNIYVHDYNALEILKISPEGKLIAKIGRDGNGPGEFKNIRDFCLTKNDEVVFFDMPLQRITLYDQKKSKFTTNNFKGLMEPIVLEQLNNSAFILTGVRNNVLFTVYSKDFKDVLEEFGEAKSMIKLDDKYQSLSFPRLNILVIDSIRIAATTKWYNKTNFLFKKENGKWVMKKLEGYKAKKRSYETFEKINPEKFLEMKLSFISSSRGKIAYKLYNRSAGLARYKNKYILHFISSEISNNEFEFGVDLFSIEGEYLGYTKLSMVRNEDRYPYILTADKEGSVYLHEFNNKVPVIKKYKLTIN